MAMILRSRHWLIITVLIMLTAAAGAGKRFDLKLGEGEGEGEEERQRELDRVVNLPGQPKASFQHYAGYIQLGAGRPKALFYWFFEAQDAVSQRPLVLWLNGGPGCSSVAYGAAQELGPFVMKSNETQLTLNKYSWNLVANLLFVESPVGVGFSYTNHTKDLRALGDRVTADDCYAFLLGWFKRFPNFKSNEFYIAGESYAGHYVPQLADLIYERNRKASEHSYINIKGFMIGNAVLNDKTDSVGFVEYAWSHAVISDELYEGIMRECALKGGNATDLCSVYYQSFMDAYEDIDIYSIYTPACLSSSSGTRTIPRKFPLLSRRLDHDFWHNLPSGYDPCTERYVQAYFNREDVQRALHANVTKLPYAYSTCSSVIEKWNDSPDTVLPIIQKLLSAGIRIWVYSGDTDGRVPVTATRYSINEMKMKIKKKWRQWFHKEQVAGRLVTYESGLTFVTVSGAGHQVPLFKPHQSLSLFSHFLSATPLPPKPSS